LKKIAIGDEAKQKAIEAFRAGLTASGIRAYLLSDDEVWQWIGHVVQQFERLRVIPRKRIVDANAISKSTP